jgi:hypothetical protein
MQLVKDFSNQLCREYGLVECPNKSEKKDYKFGEYYAAEKGQSWKIKLINSIDGAMGRSRTKAEFINTMNKLGYDVKWTDSRKYITYTTSEGQKCRDNKLHDEKYLKENMEAHYEKLRQIKGLEPGGNAVGGIQLQAEYVRGTAGVFGNAVADADSYGEGVSGDSGMGRVAAGRDMREDGGAYSQREGQYQLYDDGIGEEDFEGYEVDNLDDYDLDGEYEYDDEYDNGDEYQNNNNSQTVDNSGFGVASELIYLAKSVEDMVNSSNYDREKEKRRQERQAKKQQHKQNKSHEWEMEM